MTSTLLAPLPTLTPSDAIAAIPAEPLGALTGVTNRVLWHDGISMAGVLTIQAGHGLGHHTHRAHHHHIWVLDGEVDILGTRLGRGGYAHVPSGVEHDIDATATGGCSVFYLYVRLAG
jgi:quercetin dioxygenase-like cupin family protein